MLTLFLSYAIVLSTLAPLRSTPDYSAEQETQLLFGETCVVNQKQDGWCLVVNDEDGYTGWVSESMLLMLSEEQYRQYHESDLTAITIAPYTLAYSCERQQTIPLTAGTHLSQYHDGQFSVLGKQYTIDPTAVQSTPLALNYDNLMRLAMPFVNTPYQWGGKSCMGMDCSGFADVVMSLFGKSVLRNADQQATQGITVESIDKAQAGDLVFFNHVSTDSTDTTITHVGVVVSPQIVMHCIGQVHFDYLRDGKLVSATTGRPTHDIALIKRY